MFTISDTLTLLVIYKSIADIVLLVLQVLHEN